MKIANQVFVRYEQPQRGEDTVHAIYAAGLKDGAELHRFRGGGGRYAYSAIYKDGKEVYFGARDKEAEMIKRWNEGRVDAKGGEDVAGRQ